MSKEYKPTSAYRIQLSKEFNLKKAVKILPYLQELGVDTLYTCPYFQTPKDSSNPYLITSPTHFNTNLGSEKDFHQFFQALKKLGLNHILDLVSNHLAAIVQNPWFCDVLEKGDKSPFAPYFDIIFDPYYSPLKGKVHLPLLPMPIDQAFKENYIRLVGSGNSLSLRVGPIALPLSESSQIWLSKHKFHPRDMEQLLDMQHYLITYWKSSYDVINYRRFFDIMELIGINMQNPSLYTLFHKKVFELIDQEYVQGLRIDHPDGLYDPQGYLDKLQSDYPGLFVIVEKILQQGENLPQNWPVNGSVGYEYLNLVGGLFVECDSESIMTQIYERFTGVVHKPLEMLYEIKKTIVTTYIKGEVNDIVYLMTKEAQLNFERLKEMLIELLCHIPVYRTYMGEEEIELSKQDRNYMVQAFSKMESSYHTLHDEEVEQLKVMFCIEPNIDRRFRKPLMRLQQLMPCVMAKSLEDTFLYRYHRLISLNDVGGSPLNFGTTIEQFHKSNQYRQQHHPYGFIATSTHDTKRSEDVRHRISMISHMPHRFEQWINEWRSLNKPHQRGLDANVEYFIYQTLIGFWPGSKVKKTQKHIERLQAYMIKAIREAKDYTNWVNPNEGYESNVAHFITAILTPGSTFVQSLNQVVDEIAPQGQMNSLHAIALKAGSPGVFDLYQGTEVFDDSLVDPDNRREIDYNRLKVLTKKLSSFKENNKLLDEPLSDLHKLHLIKASLYARKHHVELFTEGDYIPIETGENTIAFARQYGDQKALVIVPLKTQHELKIKLPFTIDHPVDCYFNRPLNITKDHIDSILTLSTLSLFPYLIVSHWN